MYIASDGIHTAVITRDSQPTDPRDPYYQDNLATMICWHHRYNLGDQHAFEDSQAFFENLAEKHLIPQDLFRALQQGTIETLRLNKRADPDTFDSHDVVFDIQYRQGTSRSAPDWQNTGWTASENGQLKNEEGESLSALFQLLTTRELRQALERSGTLAVLPLYLYDHSGISMSTQSFAGRMPHAEWDSGQIGYIYVDKTSAINALGCKEDTWHEEAIELLKAEVAEYDNYLTGNIYSIQFYEGLESNDGYGDYNPGRYAMTDCFEDLLDGWHPELAQCFEYTDDTAFDITRYFEEKNFPDFRKTLSREVETFLAQVGEPYPFAISKSELLHNGDGIKDAIVDTLYQAHEHPSQRQIFYAIADAAGYSREVQPRLTAADLTPGKDYTKDELLSLLKQKTNPLDTLLSQANSKRELAPAQSLIPQSRESDQILF